MQLPSKLSLYLARSTGALDLREEWLKERLGESEENLF